MSSKARYLWQPFVRASVGIGLSAGFATGAMLFAALVFDSASGPWWPAVAQAHGHAQLYGWAGLMVLGIGIHFLPRLASAPGVDPTYSRPGFWILLSGLVLVLVSRPMMAVSEPAEIGQAARITWTAGAAAELIGVLVILIALGRSITFRSVRSPNPAMRSLQPLLVTAFASLVAVTAIRLTLGLYRLAGSGLPLGQSTSDRLILLTFYGFLVPVSIAMSTRLFPLYVRTVSPNLRPVKLGLILLLVGIVIRLSDIQRGLSGLNLFGRALILAGIVSFVLGLRIFEARRALPRRPIRLWKDPTGLHALSAYVWLLAAAVVQTLGVRWQDVEIHLLGMGFITLLIFGMGVHLLPGFVRSSMRHSNYVWATLIFGNLATILRAIPSVPGVSLPGRLDNIAGATAGITGLLALLLFAVNVNSALTAGRGGSDNAGSTP